MKLVASRDPMARATNGMNSDAIADEIVPKELGQDTVNEVRPGTLGDETSTNDTSACMDGVCVFFFILLLILILRFG